MDSELKQDLLNKIASTTDEDLLLLLKSDFEYFTGAQDVLDVLSEADKTELINLVREPFGTDTVSQQEFDEAIKKWRTK
jgi:hypothetical protein